MAEVSKNDCHAVFKRLHSIPTNKCCFDCNSKNSTWASVTYGVFLCIDCSAVHRSLGVHLSFIRSTQLDAWTWPQIRAMQVGGNANATVFFRQHGTSTTDANKKYNSRAAQLYREKIKSLAAAAMRKYGTETLHIGDLHVSSPEQKEVDFFKEHSGDHKDLMPSSNLPQQQAMNLSSSPPEEEVKVQPVPIKNGQNAPSEGDTREPSVDHVLGTSPSQSLAKAEPRKSTIGQRKPMGAKKGLGAKKGKLGAQKVTTNFADIESAAHQADLMKQETANRQKKTKEEEAANMASMRLAYQDMTVELKKQEERMKNADPKKAEQMERLGMGFGGRSAVSHSAMSDMQTIKQEKPSAAKSQRSSSRDFFDDYEDTRSSSYSSRNKDDIFSSRKDRDDDIEKDDWDILDKPKDADSYDSIKPLADRMPSGKKKQYEAVSSSTEAQKRFANAKSISSDAYFGSSEMDATTKSNLDRFAGKSSISSSDFYGDQSSSRSSYSSGTDMAAIKDGMKDSVTQVAGRLSRMANGLMSSIQDKYGY
ncbi:ADP-ribosylation factor GTPase-activating protein 2-like [Acanthaster planci]|uniref:ADP-ribosylation factor GTPase-activating protein 2-like n=1 Tax=Acanthaster planci TaxID=133434 RepID=A0A8B8A616_ACAPL|nr:ADP-ribosylation factor GTPase-activating protein 2-like [Acanthaster planci]